MTSKSFIFLLLTWFLISCDGENSEDTPYSLFLADKSDRMTVEMIRSNSKIVNYLLASDSANLTGFINARKTSFQSIDSLTNVLINICGGRNPDTGEIKNLNNISLVQDYLVEQEVGQLLKSLFNVQVKYLNNSGYKESPIAFDANEVEVFKDGPWGNMTFSESHFKGSKLQEALATISAYKLDMAQLENRVLVEKLIEREKNGL